MTKYTCPMPPQVLKDEPGKCPLCGMALVPLSNSSAAHEHNAAREHPGDTSLLKINKK
ncbi:heavy metal-binding domain-containing protein [Niabella hirudinis]|uniref:heavy metal-binding domain-containing protein n=1 Tax=Niabella hirudinis TaxID=1285929 RepID=UPI003EC0B906